MKNRLNLSIFDITLSATTDLPVEVAEDIARMLDRKMREVYHSSRNHCSKTEAALLSSLEVMEERLELRSRISELEESCATLEAAKTEAETKVAADEAELSVLREETAAQKEELERLRRDNEFLRTVLSRGGMAIEPIAPDPVSPHEFFSGVAAAQSGATAAPEGQAPAASAAPEAPAAPTAEGPRSRSRVGSMFDLLSFGDAD